MMDDDDGHYSVIHETDYYNNLAFNRQQRPTSNDDIAAVEQRSPSNYEQLDPSVLATLRQPPTPSVYAGLDHASTSDAGRGRRQQRTGR